MGYSMLILYGKWFAPIALATPTCITHFIVDMSFPDFFFFKFINHHFNCIPHHHAVDEVAILQNRILGGIGFLAIVVISNNVGDRNIKMLREFVITLISAWHP